MCERAAFIGDKLKEEETLSELCRRFGISRKTGYKWLERFEMEGDAGLQERSRAPRHHSNSTPGEVEAAIVVLRQKRPSWGPKKIAVGLRRDWAEAMIPAVSTIGDIVKRNGLVVPRKFRRRATPSAEPLAHATECNRVWCADFKGWFRTGDGQRVDPLTVTDAYSRYLLGCQWMEGKTDTAHVMGVMETLFRTYGLPERMRTDNGPPFASTGLAGLSRLSVWWVRLGIVVERIEPGKPSENGRHERFHLTLKQETAMPPASTPKRQQQAFDRFQQLYNEERPHEALGQVPPAAVYTASLRTYPQRLPVVVYSDDMQVRRVRGGGQVKWRGKDVHLTDALINQPVGFQPIGDGVWAVFFCQLPIGMFDERKLKILTLKSWHAKHNTGEHNQ
jgi:putative transposase